MSIDSDCRDVIVVIGYCYLKHFGIGGWMRVFISYLHADVLVAQKLKNYLVCHDIDVLDDKYSINTGSNLLVSINEAINRSDAVLFLISKDTDKSELAQQEISLAVTNKLNGRDIKLIPIVIEKNANIPFFLKDYIYLDMSDENGFEQAMSLLMKGLMIEQTTSVEDEQAIKIQNIMFDRKALRLQSIEYENYKKIQSKQMTLFALLTILISALVVSIIFLGWFAKVEYSQLAWLIAFSIGVMVTMIGAFLYVRKELRKSDDIIRKIKEANGLINKMESFNGK